MRIVARKLSHQDNQGQFEAMSPALGLMPKLLNVVDLVACSLHVSP
jgi:hypothetical protein